MLEKQRYDLIIRELEQNESISVQRLMELTHVSRSTLRRDIDHLESQKMLTRIHGAYKGVMSASRRANSKTVEPPPRRMVSPGFRSFLAARAIRFFSASVFSFLSEIREDGRYRITPP